MVKQEIRHVLKDYDVHVQIENKAGRSEFWTITDLAHKNLVVTLHFLDEQLYSIFLLNNEFYELTEPQFQFVLNALLTGKYELKINRHLKAIRSIQIFYEPENHYIYPERIHGAGGAGDYSSLPTSFTRKN
jgi:hypothetical protein